MNPTQLATFSSRAALVGETLWPTTVTIGGDEYPAECPRPLKEKVALEPGYEEIVDMRTVRIRKALLPVPPALNSFLTMDGSQWQIRTIGGDNTNSAQWTLGLQPKK